MTVCLSSLNTSIHFRPTWYHFIGLILILLFSWTVIGVSCFQQTPYEWEAQLINYTLHSENTSATQTGKFCVPLLYDNNKIKINIYIIFLSLYFVLVEICFESTLNQRGFFSGVVRISLACLLFCFYQMFRVYESMFVVMYSGRGVTNPIIMIVTTLFQLAQTLTILAHGPSFTNGDAALGMCKLNHWCHASTIVLNYKCSV